MPGLPSSSLGEASGMNPVAKLAIPRLKTDPGLARGTANRRVTRACQLCREKKIKCSGDQPACTYCQSLETPCHYTGGKREQTKKHLKRMSAKVNDYEKLLQELSTRVGEQDSTIIRSVLEKFGSAPSGFSTPKTARDDDFDENAGLSDDDSVGSVGAAGRADEDYDRSEDTRTTGFLGQSSEITWMQKLKLEEDLSVSSVSYHLDDLKIQDKEAVDPFALPDYATSEKLLEAYLDSVHPSFPILEKRFLIRQHELIYKGKPSRELNRKISAIFNLVFAIAAKFSHLTLATWAGDIRDHLVYFSRARMLSMDGQALFCHPDIQQIQVEGLVSFYLIATGQINRAWRISSIPLRSAIALGMNLENRAPDTDPCQKEIRYRVWWSLLIIERLLGNMTGRPTCLTEGVSTLPLPLPFDEDMFEDEGVAALLQDASRRSSLLQSTEGRAEAQQPSRGTRESFTPPQLPLSPESNKWLHNIPPNDSLYFFYSTDLTLLAQDILNKLYTTKSAQYSWSEIVRIITDLEKRFNTWFSSLPECYNFTIRQNSHIYGKEKLRLAMLYYSSKILLTRPCMCRLSRKEGLARKASDENMLIASECVESACLMLEQLPNERDAIALHKCSPWWCVIHYLMQATAVLLLELSFNCRHVPQKVDIVKNSAKKAILWLHEMAKCSATSQRAWTLCDDFARRLAPHIGLDVSDLPRTLTPHAGRPALPNSPNMVIDTPQSEDQPPSFHHPSELHFSDVNFPASNDYDEYLPFDPITGEITGSLFPIGMDPIFHSTN